MPSPLLRLGAYALCGIAIAFELAVLWLMLHPQPAAEYRAYYLDQTTTCLAQPVSGAYVLGTPVSFLPDGKDAALTYRVCGWQGPSSAGTSSVGDNARLRFVFPPVEGPLILQLRALGVQPQGNTDRQPVEVEVNGKAISRLSIRTTGPTTFRVPLPAELVAASNGHLEIELRFPGAVQLRPWTPDVARRAIRLLSVTVGELHEESAAGPAGLDHEVEIGAP